MIRVETKFFEFGSLYVNFKMLVCQNVTLENWQQVTKTVYDIYAVI